MPPPDPVAVKAPTVIAVARRWAIPARAAIVAPGAAVVSARPIVSPRPVIVPVLDGLREVEDRFLGKGRRGAEHEGSKCEGQGTHGRIP
jgi:hypothetical protein